MTAHAAWGPHSLLMGLNPRLVVSATDRPKGDSSSARKTGGRIAILLPSLLFGGAERVAVNLARALKQLGWDVAILLMSKEGEFLEEAGTVADVVDLHCDRTYKLPQRLASYLAENPTDILLSSFWKLNLCACIARIFTPKIRLLLWEHSRQTGNSPGSTIFYLATASLFYRMAETVVCVSGGVANDVERRTVGLKSRLRVIHNPIPPPLSLLPVSERSVTKRIAWVGRLHGQKNPGLILDALALVSKETDASVVFIGDGALRTNLERQADKLGLSERVIFAGFQTDPYTLLSQCDLLALTSDWEGFGNVLVEAMHCGLGVVTTDCGEGVHEILGDSEYGTIVPKRDAKALAEAIQAELADPRDRDRQMMGALRFLPEAIARQFLSTAAIDKA